MWVHRFCSWFGNLTVARSQGIVIGASAVYPGARGALSGNATQAQYQRCKHHTSKGLGSHDPSLLCRWMSVVRMDTSISAMKPGHRTGIHPYTGPRVADGCACRPNCYRPKRPASPGRCRSNRRLTVGWLCGQKSREPVFRAAHPSTTRFQQQRRQWAPPQRTWYRSCFWFGFVPVSYTHLRAHET